MNISTDILKQFEDITYNKLKTYGFGDFETTYEHERELACILSDSTSGVLKPDEIYFEEHSIKTALKNWKEILRQWGIMPTSPTTFGKMISVSDSKKNAIINRFYKLIYNISVFNDRYKVSSKKSKYDTGSKYAAAGVIIVGVIGIICCITLGWLRANNDKQDSITLNATLDEQYQECVKENECEFEAGNN